MQPPADMLSMAAMVRHHAYAPYSHFKVGACVRATDGSLFASGNVENASYSLATCAETNATAQLIIGGHKEITDVLVLVAGSTLCPPCGACRQRLMEFSAKNLHVHLCTTEDHYQKLALDTLLPHAFSANNWNRHD